MGRARLLAALAALQLASCTLLFDEPKYLLVGGGGAGGGGAGGSDGGSCSVETCNALPVAVYAVDPTEGTAADKVKSLAQSGRELLLESEGGDQNCAIGWDGDDVLIGCSPAGGWYLLLEFSVGGEYFAYEVNADGSVFTTDCTDFDCTGSEHEAEPFATVVVDANGDAALVSLPTMSALGEVTPGESFKIALELGSSTTGNVAFFPLDGASREDAVIQTCTKPENCP